MGIFDDAAKRAARDMLKTVGGVATYHGAGGDVTTVTMIGNAVYLLGSESAVSERHTVCTLLAEDVTAPRKGETVTDDAGQTWELASELEADSFLSNWSVTRSTE